MNKVRHPKSLTFSTPPANEISLIVHGQGTIIFTPTAEQATLTFSGPELSLQFQFTPASISGLQLPSAVPLNDPKNTKGLKPHVQHWISLDAQNKRVIAGVGEARIENLLYSYTFAVKAPLASLIAVHLEGCTPLRLLRDPITRCVPLIIRPTDALSMNDVAGGKVVAKSHLSPVAHKLFDCVSGTNFVLDGPDFPDFSRAITKSINDPNGWCYKRLVEKSGEFGKSNPDETYLRITIGENNGESPGIPYVMEIWPSQHYSPVHNHGSANAIVRVLSGTINVSLYPHLGADVAPFAVADFVKDDITWLSPELNQVHQLRNVGAEPCITIQCYLYDLEDKDHYDYFDYLDSEGRVQQYEPDSDMDFLAFKELMRQEWLGTTTPKSRGLKRLLCRG